MSGLQQRLVYALVIVNVAVHFGDLPSWIPTLGVLFVSWRWAADLVRIPCPGRIGAAVIALLCGVGVWVEFGRFIGDPASTGLLLIMVALKTLEIRGYRDLMIVTYLCLLLLMSKLLSSQSISMMGFLFVDLIAVLALMHLYHVPNIERGLPWRRSLRLVAQAIPVLAVLFVLFPRFNFSLIRRSADSSASVGFSGQLRPGSVSQLAQSDKVAFRAFFKGKYIPPMQKLYWRGAVLTQSRGLDWDPVTTTSRLRAQIEGEEIVEVMIEEGGSSWIFTMDWPTSVTMKAQLRQGDLFRGVGHTFFMRTPIQAWESYRFSFEPSNQNIEWPENEVGDSLEVVPPTKRLSEQLKEWRASARSAPESIEAIRNFFVSNHFSYTLSPPETADLEEFLYFTRRGYCEHFAGATASLLRMLGVPARVIVGYHGGALSLMGDYMIVSQRDAHAWVEYWNKERRLWVRVDPTAWVAEERLTLGGQAFFDRQTTEGIGGIQTAWLKKVFGDDFVVWLMRSRLLVDQAEIAWITFMLRFDLNYQRDLFEKLGWHKISAFSLFALAIAGVVAVLVVVAWVMWQRRRPGTDGALRLYQALCYRLAVAGLERQFTEGPADLATRAVARWPKQATVLQGIFDQLIHIRYGGVSFGERERALLQREIDRLKFDNA
jgi:protein-glutamine gamma-glutamyltransferase